MATFLSPDRNIFFPNEKDFNEVFRYLGYKKIDKPDLLTKELVQQCTMEMFPLINPKAVFEIFPLQVNNDNETISFADLSFKSHDLCRNLNGCIKVGILASTIGPQVDNLIHRYEKIDTAKAAIMQGTGAMYIEKLVDYTNNEIEKMARIEDGRCKPRYSPGYGDVSLEIQKEFFRLLPCSKIGLTLMDSLIMAPEKSVTAFAGIFAAQ